MTQTDKNRTDAQTLRQFCCPGCGLAIENEIAVAEDPVLRDVDILFR